MRIQTALSALHGGIIGWALSDTYMTMCGESYAWFAGRALLLSLALSALWLGMKLSAPAPPGYNAARISLLKDIGSDDP